MSESTCTVCERRVETVWSDDDGPYCPRGQGYPAECYRRGHERELARALAAERHLADVAALLPDASDPAEYPAAIRELTRERDAWRTALMAREDADRASMEDRLGVAEAYLAQGQALDRYREAWKALHAAASARRDVWRRRRWRRWMRRWNWTRRPLRAARRRPMLSLFVSFDVESNGLHGQPFSVGAIAYLDGQEIDWLSVATDPLEPVDPWVKANVLPVMAFGCTRVGSVGAVMAAFAEFWRVHKKAGAVLVADCPWPVEARFLHSCIYSGAMPESDGPYPLIDVASVRLARGLDPLATCERLPNELPAHNPLADARQSARLLLEAMASEETADA